MVEILYRQKPSEEAKVRPSQTRVLRDKACTQALTSENLVCKVQTLKKRRGVGTYKFFQNWLRVLCLWFAVCFYTVPPGPAPWLGPRVSRKQEDCLRPYRIENTGSRPISEVKQCRAWLVLWWVTTWEPQVLLAFALFLFR